MSGGDWLAVFRCLSCHTLDCTIYKFMWHGKMHVCGRNSNYEQLGNEHTLGPCWDTRCSELYFADRKYLLNEL